MTSKSALFSTKLTIENFPSRAELFNLLDDMLIKNDFPKDYKFAENKDTVVIIHFNNPVT
jgi:hypothetical protein